MEFCLTYYGGIMENLLQVGGIANTHGLKGEVKVFPMTDEPARFKELKQVKLKTNDGYIDLEIERVRFFKQFVILKFKGIDDINDIEKYKGNGLFVTRENAVSLEEDEYFIADLIGLDVLDESGKKIAVLKDVIQTGANDVYALRMEESGEELLIPAIKDCVLQVNMEEGYIKIHIMEGLL